MKRKQNKKNRRPGWQKKRKLPELTLKHAARLVNQGRLNEAEQAYVRLAAKNKDSVEIFFNLGSLLHQKQNFTEAAAYFERANLLEPFNRRILLFLGDCYRRTGILDKAISVYGQYIKTTRNTLSAVPDNHQNNSRTIEVLSLLAELYLLTNQQQKALSVAQEVVRQEPLNMLANLVIAKIFRQQGKLDKARARLEQFSPDSIPNEIYASLLNELGQIHDKSGEFEDALRNFEKSNRVMEHISQDIIPALKNENAFIDNVLSCLHSESFGTGGTGFPEDDIPVPTFLVGFPRSGTTLTEKILSENFGLIPSSELQVLNKLRTEMNSTLRRDFLYPGDLNRLSSGDIQLLRKEYWRLVNDEIPLQPDQQKKFLDKMPLNIINLPLISTLFPQSKVVVCLRDPRDVCLSNFMQHFRLNAAMVNFLRFEDTVNLYNTIMSIWLVCRETLDLTFIESRYEDIVTNKESCIEHLASFFDRQGSRSHDSELYGIRKKITTPSYYDVTRPVYKTSYQRWKNYEKLLDKFFLELAPIGRRLGYTFD